MQWFKKTSCSKTSLYRFKINQRQFHRLCKKTCCLESYKVFSLVLCIWNRCAVKLDYENLFRLQKVLEEDAHSLNWDSSINPFIKSNIKHQPPAQYLEEIADILFQLDVLISSMFQYHEALILHDSKSFENFMNSFNISNEVVELLKAFAINSATLLN